MEIGSIWKLSGYPDSKFTVQDIWPNGGPESAVVVIRRSWGTELVYLSTLEWQIQHGWLIRC